MSEDSYGPPGPSTPKTTPFSEDERGVVYQEMTQVWAGPMPPSFELANLDKAVPGLAREVADEFRAEARHRRKIENRKSTVDSVCMILGYVMAGGFAGGCFATIWHAIDTQAYATAGLVATGALVGGISAFLGNAVIKRKVKQSEPEED